MKKKISLIFMAMCFCISLLSVDVVAVGFDAFSEITALDYDEAQGTTEENGSVAGPKPGDFFMYENIDFGAGAVGFEVLITVDDAYAGGILQGRIDSLDGEIILEHKVEATGGWNDFKWQKSQLNRKVTGKHDLYFTVNQVGTGNIKAFTFVSESDNNKLEKYTDLKGYSREEEINLLGSLNIFDFGDSYFNPENSITRGEFSKIIYNIATRNQQSIDDIKAEKKFFDVKEDNLYFKYVYYVSEYKYINGYGDGFFGVNDYVTYEQALSVLVNMIGYKPKVDYKGGYPNGYFVVANDEGLLKGVNASRGKSITRYNLALLILNALDAPLFEGKTYSQSVTYEKLDDITYFSRYYNLYKNKGLVTANKFTSLTNPNDYTVNDSIRINNKNYKIKNSEFHSFLGYNVEYYLYSADSNEYVYYMYNGDNNKVYSVDIDLLSDISNTEITYYVDKAKEKTLKKKLDTKTDILYNGSSDLNFTKNDIDIMKNKTGIIMLIDNNNDSIIDIIDIKSYDTYITHGVSQDKKTLYLKNGDNVNIDSSNENQISIIKNYEEVKAKDISENDVLSIAINKVGNPKKIITILANNEFDEGVVTQIDNDYIYVDNQKYSFNDSVKIEVGQAGRFYLDYFNNISYIDLDYSAIYKYGFIVKIAEPKGLETNTKIRMYTQDGEMIDFDTHNNFSINLQQAKDYNTVLRLLKEDVDANGDMITGDINKIVRYKTSKLNILKDIDTAVTYKEELSNENRTQLFIDDTDLYYRPESGYFRGKCSIDGDTLVFLVPNDLEDDDSYHITNRYYFTDDVYEFKGYNGSLTKPLELLLLRVASKESINSSTPFALVDRVAKTFNEFGEVEVLYAYVNGRIVRNVMKNTGMLSSLNRGDIVRYQTDNKDRIISLTKVFNCDGSDTDNPEITVNKPATDATTYPSVYRAVYGQVVDVEDGRIALDFGAKQTEILGYNIKGVDVYIYNLKDNTIKKGSYLDVSQNSMIVLRSQYSAVREIVIYE